MIGKYLLLARLVESCCGLGVVLWNRVAGILGRYKLRDSHFNRVVLINSFPFCLQCLQITRVLRCMNGFVW